MIKLFGQEEYTIDPTKDDLFTKVIEMRTTVKNNRKKHPKTSAEYAHLDAIQLALKAVGQCDLLWGSDRSGCQSVQLKCLA